MSYIETMISPVITSRRADYVEMVGAWHGLLRECGALRIVECWGNDVPDGKVTDFKRAVQAEPNETVVVTWITWPSKAVRDEGNAKLRKDPRAQLSGDLPFSLTRMIYAGFEVLADSAGELTA